MRQTIILLAGLWLTGAVWAETAYVTDMLQLNMHATRDLTGAPVKKLRSGDKLDVISRTGRIAEVKAEDGLQGWVKSLYLVTEEPARTRLNQLERSNEGLESTVKKLRQQLSAEQDKVSGLQEVQSGSEEQRASVEAELENLRTENTRLESKLDAYGMNVPVSWLLIAFVVALIGGFAGGWYWIDSRSRARHGGYRIY